MANSKTIENSLKRVNPSSYKSGASVFKKFMERHIVHSVGYFILAPSGTGKTYFVNNQKRKHWIDADKLWEETGAHPHWKTVWWEKGDKAAQIVDQRCDVITLEAKKLGLWLLGASNFWLKPDAIVMPDFELQKKYVAMREEAIKKGLKDGGAGVDDYRQMLNHRKRIKKTWLQKKLVPEFKTIKEAALFLKGQYKKTLKNH